MQSCLQAHPIKKSHYFQPTCLLGWFTTRSEKPWSDTGETEDMWLGTWKRGGWQLSSGLWIKDCDSDWVQQHWKSSSKPKATPAEGKLSFSLILFLLGEPLSRLSHRCPNTGSGKETSDSLIAGSLRQAIAWRIMGLRPGSWQCTRYPLPDAHFRKEKLFVSVLKTTTNFIYGNC